jgi:hypothetical protein
MWRFDPEMDPGTWKAVDSPASATLYDVVRTAYGPCAVGKRGRVLGRSSDGEWGVVVENGPSARGETLYCAAATDDGERVWFGGANGALGYYDLEARTRADFSEPVGVGNAFHAIAVAGERGTEKLLVADGSGYSLPGDIESGTPDWDDRRKPAGGTALTGVGSDREGIGYAVDSNANVWRTTAEGWRRTGVAGAQNSLYAVTASTDRVVVGGGNGRVYERRLAEETASDRGDPRPWTPYTLGSFTVEALTQRDGRLLAAGSNGSICVRRVGRDWTPVEWSGSKTLLGVALGGTEENGSDGAGSRVAGPSVAVGKNGTIVERVSTPE